MGDLGKGDLHRQVVAEDTGWTEEREDTTIFQEAGPPRGELGMELQEAPFSCSYFVIC